MSLSTSRLSKIICQNLLHIDATSSNNAYQAQGAIWDLLILDFRVARHKMLNNMWTHC
jgi:hypothetical protein